MVQTLCFTSRSLHLHLNLHCLSQHRPIFHPRPPPVLVCSSEHLLHPPTHPFTFSFPTFDQSSKNFSFTPFHHPTLAHHIFYICIAHPSSECLSTGMLRLREISSLLQFL